MRYLGILAILVLGLAVYSCSREAPTESPDVGLTAFSGPNFVAALKTETLGDIGLPLPEATGILAAGVGLRGDPAVKQPGTISFNVPGNPVKAFLYWEGQMGTNVVGDDQVMVDGMAVTGTLLGGPTTIVSDEWTTSFRADITDKVSSGANSLQISGMEFDSRCPDCRNDGAAVVVLYSDGGAPFDIGIKDGNDLAFINFPATRDATVPQTFNFTPDDENVRQATLVLGVGSVNSEDRPNVICVSFDGGTPTEYPDLMGDTDGDDWDTVTLTPDVPVGASSLTVELKSKRADSSEYPEDALPASLVWVVAGLGVPPPPVAIGCRVTGGLVDRSGNCVQCPDGSSGENFFTAGGQAGANTALPPQPSGNWTHSNKKGPAGGFTFHAGTPSAPEGTEIAWIQCMDPDNCVPAREAPAKQIDFGGVGVFRAVHGNVPDIIADKVTKNVSLHYFEVNIDDLGEPGKSGKQDPADTNLCPEDGFGMNADTELANCACPDYYRIIIWAGPTDASEIIYEASGYIKGGNFQIHPLTGFDQ